MNKNKLLLNFTALSFAVLSTMPCFSVQDVYEYKNKDGVTEFTDQIEADKKLEKHIQIQKRTPEQEAQSKAKLDEIIKKDNELDKKIAKERQLENDRLRRSQEQARQEKIRQQTEDSDSGVHYDADGRYYRRDRIRGPVNKLKPGMVIEPEPISARPLR